ncbi:MAG: dihydroorotate dehydrogenase electron transfer subunit [Nitriliruptoraceae bacterium]
MMRTSTGLVEGREQDERCPVRVDAEVLLRRREGAYWLLSFAAPQIALRARPGQFLNIAVGAPGTLLRRPFSIARVSRQGAAAGTIDVVFDAHGPGTEWLTHVELHDFIDVIGPLGNGFPLPQRKVSCLLVGGGYGAAPLFYLARELTDRQFRVDMIVGAATGDRLLSPLETKSLSVTASFTTEDGSYGHRGRVTDVMDDVISSTNTGVVYACGPNPMLNAVSRVCAERGIPVQVAVEERMACGIGVCFTCTMPMRAKDGTIRMRRTCIDGPVLNGARIAWDHTRYDVAAPNIETEPPPNTVALLEPSEAPAESFTTSRIRRWDDEAQEWM